MPEKKAKRTLTLEQVPAVPKGKLNDYTGCANGAKVYQIGAHRWRYHANGVLAYYIHAENLKYTPYEEMYRGPRA